MAFAKKCDRCGKLYEPYNVKKNVERCNGILTLNIDEYRKYYDNKLYDLCPECMETLHNWLNISTEYFTNLEVADSSKTYGDIFNEFGKTTEIDYDFIMDYRPATKPYIDFDIPVPAIVVWLINGDQLIYIPKGESQNEKA